MLVWHLTCRAVWWLPRSRLCSHRKGANTIPSSGSSMKQQIHRSMHHLKAGAQHVMHRFQFYTVIPSPANQNGLNFCYISWKSRSTDANVHAWNLAIKTYGRSESWMKAMQLFEQLQQEGMMPETFTFTSVLYACGKTELLREGKRIHVRVSSRDFVFNPIIQTALVSMYGKLRNIDSAMAAFELIIVRDVVAWSSLIAASAQLGMGLKALQLWSQMFQEGVVPDNIALICILDAYIYASNRERSFVLVCVFSIMQEDDDAVKSALITVFGKGGSYAMAIETFDRMELKTVSVWSAMISIEVQRETMIRALQIFEDMQQQGILPIDITFLSVVAACTSEENLCVGRRLHAQLVGNAQELGPSLGNSLLNMYTKCGSFENAASLFHTLSNVDVITFTALIAAYLKNGNAEGAFDFLNTVISTGHVPDQVMFNTLLEAGAMLLDPARVQFLHSFIVESSLDTELILSNSLLNAYCKAGSVMETWWIFDRMVVHDVISWNAMLGLYAQLEDCQGMLEHFHQMQQEVFFDKVTILNMLSCFKGPAALIHCKHLHTLALTKMLDSEVDVSTALVGMYGRCSNLSFAKRVFGEVKSIDLILWRELVLACSTNEQGASVKPLFDGLFVQCFIPDQLCFATLFSALCELVPISEVRRLHVHLRGSSFFSDVSANNALMLCYSKCGGVEDVYSLFYEMPKKDSVSWNTLLSMSNLRSRSEESKCIQEKMCWEGYLPDVVTWTLRLAGCVSCLDLAEGMRVHACIRHYALDTEAFVGTALLNMYSKCGKISEAQKTFESLSSRSLISWNTMISAFSQHGFGKAAVKLFDQMLLVKVSPDEATFASVLTACSHAGLHVEGFRILVCMINHGFTPSVEDVSCVVDLLGRLGRLDDAESLIDARPENATVRSLNAFLSSCRHQKDVERGERVAEKVIHIDANAAAAFVLLSNLYVYDDAVMTNALGQ